MTWVWLVLGFIAVIAVLDGLAELVDAPDATVVVGLIQLEVVDPVFLLDESVKIGDDEGDFFG